jgi:hypothetical protein
MIVVFPGSRTIIISVNIWRRDENLKLISQLTESDQPDTQQPMKKMQNNRC